MGNPRLNVHDLLLKEAHTKSQKVTPGRRGMNEAKVKFVVRCFSIWLKRNHSNSFIRRTIMCKKLIFGMLVIIILSVNVVQAATISIVDLPATGTDDAISINSGKIYTHTFDFGSNAPVTINGVAFEQGPTANLSSVYTGT